MLLRALLLFSIFSLLLSACDSSSETAAPLSDTDELPFQTLLLTDLDAFQSVEATNWQTAGQVYANRQEAEHLQANEGEGILANLPDEQNRANLFTVWEHGDIDLSLDFMMPKNSNSGIYLQGRYEVQLLDSWGKDSVGSGDCGAIYERWREDQQRGYEGHAPRLNACRAPGLWQHLDVKFTAPRFDEQGKKIANARFDEVRLNGTLIHQNVEVSGPTRAAAFEDEKAHGPLVIQGDHGPVAIQNIRYKTYELEPVKLVDLRYRLYEGRYEDPAALAEAPLVKEEPTDSISFQLGGGDEPYALDFEGKLDVPTDGEYLFILRSAGPSWLYLDDTPVTDNQRSNYMDRSAGHYRVTLKAGTHPFRLVYTKYEVKWIRGLSLYCEGPGVRRQALHAPGSVPQSEPPVPMIVRVADEPILQRAFMYHRGEKKTHVVAVGLPTDINYAVDLKNASLLATWDKGFVDVADMWHQRGEPQTAQPLGSPLELSDKPTFARLASGSAAWPDSAGFENDRLQTKGYSLDAQGMPVFHYQLGPVLVNDYLHGGNAERQLVREIDCDFQDTGGDPMYCLVAEGDRIEQLPDGSYGIDGKRYYLTVEPGSNQLQQRTNDGRAQLLAKMIPKQGKASLRYGIVW